MARKSDSTGAKAPTLYNVIRRDYYGAPPCQCGAGLTKERAEEYAAEMRQAERASFEVVPA